MSAVSPLSYTEHEMLESKELCKRFDFDVTKELAQSIEVGHVIFTGMGSSVLFPGKQAKNRATHFCLKNKIDVFFASDLLQYEDFSHITLFLCSNSGETKETIVLHDYAVSRGARCVAVTAKLDSTLAKKCKEKIFLSGGFEVGVAATKSVIEQGLIYDSLIFHLAKNQGRKIDFLQLKEELVKTGKAIAENTLIQMKSTLVEKLATYPRYLYVGLDNGVGEEITLKTHEIVRKFATFYPDTHIVHGPGEAMDKECIFLLDPSSWKGYLTDFQSFAQKTNSMLVGIGGTSLGESIPIVIHETFKNYCLLAGGWGLLRNIAHYLRIDIDHPEKISKIGNLYQESSL